jgi:hypothetical protein
MAIMAITALRFTETEIEQTMVHPVRRRSGRPGRAQAAGRSNAGLFARARQLSSDVKSPNPSNRTQLHKSDIKAPAGLNHAFFALLILDIRYISKLQTTAAIHPPTGVAKNGLSL